MDLPNFAEKKKVSCVISTTARFPYTFDERVTYSTLVFLARFGKPQTVGSITRYSHPSIRVESALETLTDIHLVRWGDGGCVAAEPVGEQRSWFAW